MLNFSSTERLHSVYTERMNKLLKHTNTIHDMSKVAKIIGTRWVSISMNQLIKQRHEKEHL